MTWEVVALDHVQLAMPARGEDLAEAFYSGVLGLDRLPKPPALAARGGCWFGRLAQPGQLGRGGVQVHLGVEADFRPARKAHPALRVSGLAELAAAIEASGHTFRWDDEKPGVCRGYVDDPFGNRIELIDD